jgi:hypothetical protein
VPGYEHVAGGRTFTKATQKALTRDPVSLVRAHTLAVSGSLRLPVPPVLCPSLRRDSESILSEPLAPPPPRGLPWAY